MKALTAPEILAVLEIADIRLRAMVLLAYKHGMRASEVCGLRMADLDMRNGKITVRRLKRSLTTVQALSDVPGQPLLSELPVLQEWLTQRDVDRPESPFVFPGRLPGTPTHRNTFFQQFLALANAAGLPAEKKHPHCLKHSLGYTLVSANVSLPLIKQALGHRNIASTVIYAVPTDEQVGIAMRDAVAGIFA